MLWSRPDEVLERLTFRSDPSLLEVGNVIGTYEQTGELKEW
jgi:hypothetical protein